MNRFVIGYAGLIIVILNITLFTGVTVSFSPKKVNIEGKLEPVIVENL